MIADELPDDYTKYLALALLLIAIDLKAAEHDPDRRAEMGGNIAEKQDLIAETFGLESVRGSMRSSATSALCSMIRGVAWSPPAARTLLVDAFFANPFAPAEIKFSKADHNKALENVARAARIRGAAATVKELNETATGARKSHRKWFQRPITWGAFALVGAILLGGIGFLAAPAIAGAIGASAGLGGAAATSYGLAVLGGGSLAAGGAGMAGGMALVTAAGVGVGAVTGGGAALLMNMSADQAKWEIVKLQTMFAYVLVPYEEEEAASAVIEMGRNEKALEKRLSAAKKRKASDKKIGEIEAKLDAVKRAREWMKARL